MKKALALLFVCFLAGCARDVHIPNVKMTDPLQGNAPDMCIPVVPSERALAMTDVNFHSVADQIRFDIKYNDYVRKFQNIKRIHLDYTILPATEPSTCLAKDTKGGKATQRLLAGEPERYYMKISFFKCPQPMCKNPNCKNSNCKKAKCKKKPCHSSKEKPDFEETITIRVDSIPPLEAMRLLAREVIIDQTVSPLKKLKVDLGAVY